MIARHPVPDLLENGLNLAVVSDQRAEKVHLGSHALRHGGGADTAVRRPPGDATGGAWIYREERFHFSPQF